jgi:hypothetical protein
VGSKIGISTSTILLKYSKILSPNEANYMNKSEKPAPKAKEDMKAISKKPLPDKNVSAEIVRRRTAKV